MRINLGDIYHNKYGFSKLAQLSNRTKDCFFDEIEIDLSATKWLDAEMCSALGAVLYRLTENVNSVNLTNIKPAVNQILSKNGFLSHHGFPLIPDHWGTTISFKRFDVSDFRFFARYIEEEFIQRPELPEMSNELLYCFKTSLFEIFNNFVQHADSQKGIFSCGQFYPNKQKLDFCLTDLGVGIHWNVRNHLDRHIAAEEAIDWATQGSNTTRSGNVPGGLGLKLLCEFIDLNEGCLRIVSSTGFWLRQGKKTYKTKLTKPFPGTTIHLHINTADENSYRLATRPAIHDIF